MTDRSSTPAKRRDTRRLSRQIKTSGSSKISPVAGRESWCSVRDGRVFHSLRRLSTVLQSLREMQPGELRVLGG